MMSWDVSYSSNDPDTLLSGSRGNLPRDRQNSMHPTGFQAMPLQYRPSVVGVDGKKGVPGLSVKPRGLPVVNLRLASRSPLPNAHWFELPSGPSLLQSISFNGSVCQPPGRLALSAWAFLLSQAVLLVLCRNNGLSVLQVHYCRTCSYDLTHEPGTVLRGSVESYELILEEFAKVGCRAIMTFIVNPLVVLIITSGCIHSSTLMPVGTCQWAGSWRTLDVQNPIHLLLYSGGRYPLVLFPPVALSLGLIYLILYLWPISVSLVFWTTRLVQNLPDVRLSRNEMKTGSSWAASFKSATEFFKCARTLPLPFPLTLGKPTFIVSSAIITIQRLLTTVVWRSCFYSACAYCWFPYLIVVL